MRAISPFRLITIIRLHVSVGGCLVAENDQPTWHAVLYGLMSYQAAAKYASRKVIPTIIMITISVADVGPRVVLVLRRY